MVLPLYWSASQWQRKRFYIAKVSNNLENIWVPLSFTWLYPLVKEWYRCRPQFTIDHPLQLEVKFMQITTQFCFRSRWSYVDRMHRRSTFFSKTVTHISGWPPRCDTTGNSVNFSVCRQSSIPGPQTMGLNQDGHRFYISRNITSYLYTKYPNRSENNTTIGLVTPG